MVLKKTIIICLLLMGYCFCFNAHAQITTTGPIPSKGTYRGKINKMSKSQVVIPNVDSYLWRHGCAPTSVGMVIAYYDENGYPDLCEGTLAEGVKQAIASDAHYSDYSQPLDPKPDPIIPDKSELGGAHTSNCIADFMETSWSIENLHYGWTGANKIEEGFIEYVSYKNNSYYMKTSTEIFSYGTCWELYKNEIDNNRPVVLFVDSDGDDQPDHAVTGIGYDEAIGEFAIYDTWDHDVHWYEWHEILPDIPWGIEEIYTFQIEHKEHYYDLKVFLEGPFSGSNMSTNLNSIIPLKQPYNIAPFNYNGNESVTTIPNQNIVDWILVEILERQIAGEDTTFVLRARKAAFLLNNGEIKDLDGTSMLLFTDIQLINCFVRIKHRNHLQITSSVPVTQIGDISNYDFTTSADKVMGGLYSVKQLATNIWGMIAGDGNANRQVNNMDKDDVWILQNGLTGYYAGDYNLNGAVNSTDKEINWEQNSGKGTDIFENYTVYECPSSLKDGRDGQSYLTVQIGTQCWMAENLNVGKRIQVTEDMTDNGIIEKYCLDDDTTYCDKYGGLYQWNEMMQYITQNGTQGICPPGWYIPSDDDWCTLTTYIDATVDCNINGWSGTDAGLKMKSTSGWYSNGNGTNIFGYTVLPGSYRQNNGVYGQHERYAYFWTSNIYDATQAYKRYFYYDNNAVTRSYTPKNSGYSIRCLKGIPQIETTNVYNITQNTVTIASIITDQGATEITERGVCWSTSKNPLSSGTHTSDGTGTGNFTSEITGLIANTHYYVRAYATNTAGTAYGKELVFVTIQGTSQSCTNDQTVIYEGLIYNTVQIGNQCWLRENINIGIMIDDDSIPKNNGIIEKYCYNNAQNNCIIYGGLYQWSEMMQYSNLPGAQGICPPGWHLPTDGEFCSLTQFIDPSVNCNSTSWSGTDVGLKMKSTTSWNSGGNGNNASGYTALATGYRTDNGSFSSLGTLNNLWTTTPYNSTYSYARRLGSSNSNIMRSYFNNEYGNSVRCLKSVPIVITENIINITENTAIGIGGVTDEGATEVNERGICWSTSPDPDITELHTSNGAGSGTFNIEITGLNLNTHYFARAYAINNAGIAYGNEIEFTTITGTAPTCAGIPSVNYENQIYNTVQIGAQCWLRENLNVGLMINATNQTNNNQKEKYCYNNDPANCAIYGGLYQWDEMMQYSNFPGTQGICPTGWHLPTNAEWCTLTSYIDPTVNCAYIGWTGTDVGIKMKSTTGWSGNGNGSNASGFNVLPSGMSNLNNNFYNLSISSMFWSSKVNMNTNTVKVWQLNGSDAQLYIQSTDDYDYGYSVRCVKNL